MLPREALYTADEFVGTAAEVTAGSVGRQIEVGAGHDGDVAGRCHGLLRRHQRQGADVTAG